jgi:hypothetical protein
MPRIHPPPQQTLPLLSQLQQGEGTLWQLGCQNQRNVGNADQPYIFFIPDFILLAL